jgi:ribosomal protein uS17
MAEKKKTKKTDEAVVEETAAEATETEAAAPSVDEGEPMASTEAMEDAAAEADPGTAEEDAAPQPEPAEDDLAPAAEQAEETAPAADEPEAAAEEAPSPEPEASPEVEAAAAPAEETPAEEPVAAEAPAEEPVVDETPAEEPMAEEAPAEEPVAEEAPAEEPAAVAEPPAPTVQQPGPKPKRKRLPRALRPTKGRPTREKSAERKPITRIPRPEQEFGRRQERQGTVVSDKGDKTIVVKVDTIKAHPKYKKVVRRSKKFHAHDEQNSAKIGDVVKIVETRPLSKTKNWRLAEIVQVAK